MYEMMYDIGRILLLLSFMVTVYMFFSLNMVENINYHLANKGIKTVSFSSTKKSPSKIINKVNKINSPKKSSNNHEAEKTELLTQNEKTELLTQNEIMEKTELLVESEAFKTAFLKDYDYSQNANIEEYKTSILEDYEVEGFDDMIEELNQKSLAT